MFKIIKTFYCDFRHVECSFTLHHSVMLPNSLHNCKWTEIHLSSLQTKVCTRVSELWSIHPLHPFTHTHTHTFASSAVWRTPIHSLQKLKFHIERLLLTTTARLTITHKHTSSQACEKCVNEERKLDPARLKRKRIFTSTSRERQVSSYN